MLLVRGARAEALQLVVTLVFFGRRHHLCELDVSLIVQVGRCNLRERIGVLLRAAFDIVNPITLVQAALNYANFV